MGRMIGYATFVLSCVALVTASCQRMQTRTTPETTVAPETPPTTRPAALRKHDSARFEREIAAYEELDRTAPPPKNAVLFIGSSTIRRWKTLEDDFPDHQVINRGFGGSQIADATYFAERVIFPYKPRAIFLRSGPNDIHAGKSAEEVFGDFKAFVAKVHAKLPETTIVFIGLCPVPARWEERFANKALNEMVERYARVTPYVTYIEAYDDMLDEDGQPRPELLASDRLHFSPEGYRILADRVRPYLLVADNAGP